MRHPITLLAAVALASGSLLTGGCLSSSHRISKSELGNLAQVAPQVRGEKVRVVQALGTSSNPPHQEGVSGNTVVVVHSPIWVSGRPRRHNYNDHRGSVGGSSAGSSAPSAPKSSGASGGSSGGLGKAKADSAKAWIILAAVAAVGLAATEGARYDGWVRLHPMHPVHLYGPNGEYLVLPLAHIDAPTAAWADHAIVVDNEGPWQTLGRAPLNRQGFTYSVFLGTGEIPIENYNADPGFAGHIQFGYFPTKQVGVQLDIGMAWTDDEFGNTIYVSRNSLELQAFLAKAGPLHGGVFGQLGFAKRFDDGISTESSSSLAGGGALLQLDITTRLALTGRVGITRNFGELSKELGVGLSIY